MADPADSFRFATIWCGSIYHSIPKPMCTVTYIVHGRDKYFTSNRDENKLRPVAAMPQTITWNGKNITFPRDPHAGGTWFAVTQTGTIAILLNGAFETHVPVYPYKKSRGLVLLEMVAEEYVHEFFEQYDLSGIEPFTIILFNHDRLFELRWNSRRKFSKQLAADKNHIWSSATLYSAAVSKKREDLFRIFEATHPFRDAGIIRNFHSDNHADDQNGFIINRSNGIQTQSITQAILREDQLTLIHQDLFSKEQQEQVIQLTKRIAIRE
ncbi:MAG: hypothetical protein EOO88_31965 [Pedobacter sp.]|nr:MAG: hypothetical protein EOO88_31965 [Pedobacter sp.]